jgi:hypothetical protein
MELTWGFLLLFAVFIFPGLIIRRLYFFGEFSKQFGYNDPLLKTVAYALVPGIINAIGAFLIYDGLFGDIDLGRVFDAYKDLSDRDHRYDSLTGGTVDDHFRLEVLPFLGWLYLQAFMIGALSGQLVRWTGLDTIFKILRFKNQWFYLFTGIHRRFKKHQAHFKTGDRFLFVKVDVLIEAAGTTKLYSGTLVDYELDANDCRELSKVVLKEAHRYGAVNKDGVEKVESKPIPGNLLVVECSKLVNINLTHVYETEERKVARDQKFRQRWYNVIVVLSFLMLPLLFFRLDFIEVPLYSQIMDMTLVGKLAFWVVVAQVLQLFNYVMHDRKRGTYRIATIYEWIGKFAAVFILYWLALGVDKIGRWMLSWFG